VDFPEPGQYLFPVVPEAGFFLGRCVALGEPVLVIVPQHLFEGGGRGRVDFKETLDAVVQGRAEAEIPFVPGLEPFDVLEFVVQGA